MKIEIVPGTRFGRFVVLDEPTELRKTNRYYPCICDCGNRRMVQKGNLQYGHSTSCGCHRLELQKISKRKHHGHPAVNMIVHDYKYSAKLRGLDFLLSHDEAASLLVLPCFHCGLKPSRVVTSTIGETATISGIDRLDNTKGYTKENSVPACKTCNLSKLDLSLDEWRDWIVRLHGHQNSLKTLSSRSGTILDSH